MIRRLLLVLLMVLVAAGAARADAQEPVDPEPIQDFWTVEEDAIKREEAAAAPAPQPAPEASAVPETAPAAAGTPPTAVAPACTPQLTLQRSLSALRTTLRRPIPHQAGRTMRTRLTPCGAGRLTLVVRHGTRGPVLARASRTLRSKQTATFRLRTTKAIERLEGKRLRLRLHVTLDLTP